MRLDKSLDNTENSAHIQRCHINCAQDNQHQDSNMEQTRDRLQGLYLYLKSFVHI